MAMSDIDDLLEYQSHPESTRGEVEHAPGSRI